MIEDEEHRKREEVLRGDISQIRAIVRDYVCEFFEEEIKEGIDDEIFFNCFHPDDWNEAFELIEISIEIEAAFESIVKEKIDFPNEFIIGSTINEIAKIYSFYFKYGRYPNKSHLHGYVVAISQLLSQIEVDAKIFKKALLELRGDDSWASFFMALHGDSLINRQETSSILVDFLMKHAPPFLGSMRQEAVEKLIRATQVLIDNPHYSNDYGYDEIQSD